MQPPCSSTFDIRDLDQKTLLAIAPHPDDETLGCGGLLSLAAGRGARIEVLFLTRGERGLPCCSPAEAAAIRELEARAAVEALALADVTLHFAGLPDGALREDLATLTGVLEQRISAIRPDGIAIPHLNDPHADHRAAAECTLRAAIGSGLRPWLLEYPTWLWYRAPFVRTGSGTLGWLRYFGGAPFGALAVWRAELNCRIDIEAVRERKRMAAQRHASQTDPGYCPGRLNLGGLAGGRFLERLLSGDEYYRCSRVGMGHRRSSSCNNEPFFAR